MWRESEVIMTSKKGSSRVVTLLGNYVIKNSKNNKINSKGVAQNRAEFELYTNDKNDMYGMNIFNNIISHSEDFKSLICEKCTKVPSIKFVKEYFYKLKNDEGLDYNNKEEAFNDVITELFMTYNLGLGDLRRPSSWGINSDGKVVLIDYGLTLNVYEEYYSLSYN